MWARSKGVTATAILSFADRSLGASTWPDLEPQIVRTPAVGHLRYSNSLLIIEDASASAVDSATSSVFHPGAITGMPVEMKLRTNPSGTEPMGSADHIIVSSVGLPAGGGRTMRAYAAEGTQVLFLIGLNTVEVNATVYFAGRLVTPPLAPP